MRVLSPDALGHSLKFPILTYAPFLEMIRANQFINRPGKLFTIIGRGTFSAASNFVTDIERATSTLLVGEATGGSPNQYGDAEHIELPNSRLLVLVSTRYHQRSGPDDPRLTHEPHIQAPLSSSDYFAGRDPALEAILDSPPSRSPGQAVQATR